MNPNATNSLTWPSVNLSVGKIVFGCVLFGVTEPLVLLTAAGNSNKIQLKHVIVWKSGNTKKVNINAHFLTHVFGFDFVYCFRYDVTCLHYFFVFLEIVQNPLLVTKVKQIKRNQKVFFFKGFLLISFLCSLILGNTYLVCYY